GTIGDLNYDGAVKASDSLIVQRAAINLVAVPDSHKPLADVNKDGKITASDALEILRYTLNLSNNENIGTAYTVYVFPEYDLEF
ncbi:MAG: dockerin type I repeat-containing protein, partial [Clostridia bacterium]|nr:dockerin type I repeat-containing protein [Clostridia bacterium]